MNLKRALWIAAGVLLLAAIYSFTDTTQLLVKPPIFLLAALAFLFSTVLWGLAWGILARIPLAKAVKLNTASLAGVLAPAGLGGDAMRVHLAPAGLAARSLAASFVTKSLKLLSVSAFLAASIFLLSNYWQSSEYLPLYFGALAFTLAAATIFILPAFAPGLFRKLSSRLLNGKGDFATESRKLLQASRTRLAAALALVAASTLVEFAAVYLALLSSGVIDAAMFEKAFVFSSFVNSLALITITPQGIGFVEGGGFLLLSSSYWAVSPKYVGSFLIAWNLVRLWIPAILGSLVAFLTDGKRK